MGPSAARQVIIDTGYRPRHHQNIIHKSPKRFKVIVCHRRMGKTVYCINEKVDKGLYNPLRNPQYAYVAPTYGQAERVAWAMLKDYTRMIPGVEYNEAKLRCKIFRPWGDNNKGDWLTIYLLGAENPDSIRGVYLDGATLDEYASMNPTIWGQVIRPALADRAGWGTFIGTPKGQNHFWDIYNTALANESGNWGTFVFKASETKILPESELLEMRAEMTEDEYEQEMECSFTAALSGAYWGKQMADMEREKRICLVPHDPGLQVDTFWDLGVNDTTVIGFVQQFRNEIRLIDCVEMSGEGIPYYAKQLKFDHRAHYVYREHNWPHDGKARDFSANGDTREQVARGLGIKPLRVQPKFDVMDGIDAMRRLLPRVYMDSVKCRPLINAWKSYEKEYDEKNKIYRDRPKHNWASHGADVGRLMAMTLKPGEDRHRSQSTLPLKANNKYNMFKR